MIGTLLVVAGAAYAYKMYNDNKNQNPDSKYNSEEEFKDYKNAKEKYEQAKRDFEDVKEGVAETKAKYKEYI